MGAITELSNTVGGIATDAANGGFGLADTVTMIKGRAEQSKQLKNQVDFTTQNNRELLLQKMFSEKTNLLRTGIQQA